jgi:hypothetical protein
MLKKMVVLHSPIKEMAILLSLVISVSHLLLHGRCCFVITNSNICIFLATSMRAVVLLSPIVIFVYS